MYRPEAPPQRRRWLFVLRVIGFGIGLAAGAFGLWRLVTSDSAKDIQIGILVGIWGLVIALISLYGTRAQVREVPVAIPVPTGPPPGGSQELDLRKVGELEQAAVAAARREFQAELHAQLERHFAAQLAAARESMQYALNEQVQAGVSRELAGLREEVAALRSELVEKVGGQLRLERIETTRLIGSDLEALQHELRRLRELGGLDQDDAAPAPSRVARADRPVQLTRVVEQEPDAAPEAVTAQLPTVATPAAPEREPAPEPVAAEPEPVAAEPEPVAAEPEPVAVEPEPVAVEPEPEPEPAPARASDRFDPFASLPRITPFEYDLDPLPEPEPQHATDAQPGNGGGNGGHASRRHAVDDDEDDTVAPSAGRRHRADDSGNDVLARILARERG